MRQYVPRLSLRYAFYTFAIVAAVASMIVVAFDLIPDTPSPYKRSYIAPSNIDRIVSSRRILDRSAIATSTATRGGTATIDIDHIMALRKGFGKTKTAIPQRTQPSSTMLGTAPRVVKKARDRPRFYDVEDTKVGEAHQRAGEL